MGTPTLTEAGMVLSARLSVELQALLDRFLRDFGVVPVTFTSSGAWQCGTKGDLT